MPTSATPAPPRNKKIITRHEHEIIQTKCSINADKGEDYAVVLQKGKGYWVKSVHVFHRHPTTKQINAYEQTASRLKFKGQKASVEGSQIDAAVQLYNELIDRAYDVLLGLKTAEHLPTEQARAVVPPLVKREAIRELIGEVYSASRMAENEGEDDTEDDDDPEAHTSREPED